MIGKPAKNRRWTSSRQDPPGDEQKLDTRPTTPDPSRSDPLDHYGLLTKKPNRKPGGCLEGVLSGGRSSTWARTDHVFLSDQGRPLFGEISMRTRE